jgi:gamma-glutamyltranspeptidase/glutathione hydrolase
MSIAVPGVVAAWSDALQRFGALDLATLLLPAIALATEGFPVSGSVARALDSSAAFLAARPETAGCYLPGGMPPRAGDRLRLSHLAESLEEIARLGASTLYGGSLGQRVADGVRAAGGALSLDDLAAHKSDWCDPATCQFQGVTVAVQPPVSQGVITLGALLLSEELDVASVEQGSADEIHLLSEAISLAFDDRDRFLGDPDGQGVTVAPFLDRDRAKERAAAVDPRRAHSAVPIERPRSGGTSHLCVVDQAGNAVSLIQSIYQDFGSGVVAGDTGILMNNRVACFSSDPQSPNAIGPSKRPLHTLTNAMVLAGQDAREIQLVLGSPGADGQVQTLLQLLVNLLYRHMPLQEAIESPRWRLSRDGTLLIEPRVGQTVMDELVARGHRIEAASPWDARMGDAHAISVDRSRGMLQGAADHRREGWVVGW